VIIGGDDDKVVDKPKNFNHVFSALLAERLAMFLDGGRLDRAKCIEIYTVIFNVLQDIIVRTNVRLDDESLNYIAQQYYLSLLLNPGKGNYELDDTIFDKMASLKNIDTKKLLLVGTLLKGTGFLADVVAEIKHRG
jgi:hypothetical protein